MKEKSEEAVILTPIYKNTSYQYHVCSNCNSKIYFEESILVPLRFDEKIKFCPYCGKEIIRYAEPKFIEGPDFDWMERFQEILDYADRKIEYEIFCNMDKEQQKELIEKAEFGKEYFGYGICWNDNSRVCDIVKEVAHRKPHYSYINKLKKEFSEIWKTK